MGWRGRRSSITMLPGRLRLWSSSGGSSSIKDTLISYPQSTSWGNIRRIGIVLLALSATFFVAAFFWARFPASGLIRQLPFAFSHQDASALGKSLAPRKGRLHLVIPATSSNADLCKLLLSAQILGYPTPVLVNYGDAEANDPYKQHLAKVEGILNYLEQLQTSDEFAQDLVLVVDGFDVWFQLRPDVLLKRYFELNAQANQRLLTTYGRTLVEQHNMTQSIIFGPDKLCWPGDFRRPACWAVPAGPLPEHVFGPETSLGIRDYNQPQWLNSGTILGPTEDLKRLFSATLQTIHENHTTDSDQFYFANVFGEQEYARLVRKPDLLQEMKLKRYYDSEDTSEQGDEPERFEPNIANKTTEYHIGIDYTSTMFQTLAFWKQHLTWTRATDSWPLGENSNSSSSSSSADQSTHNYYDVRLPHDVEQSQPPFDALQYGPSLVQRPSWAQVELHYNALTRQFPVVIHITGEKRFRLIWWQKLWFQAQARTLRDASYALDQRQISSQPIGGLLWHAAEAGDDAAAGIPHGGKGGAWSDRGGWLSWPALCKQYDTDLFDVRGDEFFHPLDSAAASEDQPGHDNAGRSADGSDDQIVP